ncbi:glucose-1-phosphate thymidylyltransferase [Caldinitratiruptor microaerophilus]|uniref:Glucose-1-phosphate thymidylyltransferase n=1 Tax=Caldinitratiruptor microaerophilus TaxID=671077 RepID=A0AA35CLV6_9FIRM|nr:glucose-1-phosphate thymidylyltransferase [Caldinitratiruptor microaerophilus]BDG61725.1 glucose-1-phosphate thymidylyltransferase [Caldinitratiruptor microaerophilus]
MYSIEALREAGITDFRIVVGDTAPEVMAAVGDGSRWGIRVTYLRQDAPRGLAHAVHIAEDFMAGEPFVMFLGDNVLKGGVADFVRRFRETRPDALILLSRVPDAQRFGVAELRDGRVVRLVEKPEVPPSDLALVGVYLFNHRIFEAVRVIKPSWRGELEITDAIQQLVDWGYTVEPHLVEGWWKDTGKPEDVLEANRLLLDTIEPRVEGEVDASELSGRVRIGAGTRVVRSVVRGPVVIGEGCEIEDAYIGPFTSIGDRCRVRGSEVENSVILEGCVIDRVGVRIDGSLLGRGVVLERAPDRPRAISLVLGDQSRARIV